MSHVDWEIWRREKSPFEDVLGFFQIQAAIEMCRGEEILDVGCGDGYLTRELLKHFKNVTGVDESTVALNKAKINAKGATIIQSSIEDFKPARKFDTVLMINVLEHVKEPVKKLATISKWLKGNGQIIIHVPNAYSVHRRLGKYMNLLNNCTDLNDADRAIGHKIVFDMNGLIKTVKKAGLVPVRQGGLFFKPLSGPQMVRLYNAGLWENDEQRDRYFKALNKLGTDFPELASIIYVVCKKNTS
ncbi:class I SAM-dependent methyltransferase [Nitrososphaera sp.]|uniref:class I SAM-dependent methyltransferase n=1 Tax=Nitrososphaera sp. TaxID=1971748 RepID=UPI0017C084FF|nr:class I SAM-dependent methyltransferase [Nitrososphaera sp.]NWG36464.1 class I SAM-dependent methyltransferase [Nitrososphaera sp.]